jgi:hypothetical protein
MVIDQGLAAIVAAILSVIVAVISLIVSIRTERARIHLESKLNLALGIEQEKRNLFYSQLSEFYDPIFSLLSVNKRIFERIGPNSEARWDRSFPEEETAEVWNKLVERVITPNNLKICEMVQTKLYLLSPTDRIDPYMEFITHAYAYQVFREKPYEAYRLFRLPADFFDHVESQRNALRRRVEMLLSLRSSKEQGRMEDGINSYANALEK